MYITKHNVLIQINFTKGHNKPTQIHTHLHLSVFFTGPIYLGVLHSPAAQTYQQFLRRTALQPHNAGIYPKDSHLAEGVDESPPPREQHHDDAAEQVKERPSPRLPVDA